MRHQGAKAICPASDHVRLCMDGLDTDCNLPKPQRQISSAQPANLGKSPPDTLQPIIYTCVEEILLNMSPDEDQ